MNVDIGTAQDKLASIEKALQEPAFQQSPVYKETKQFFDAYKQVEQYLQEVRTTAEPKIGGGFWYAQEEAKKLDNFATQLMIQNPAFSRMYYGVFSSLVKVG
jgi:hypothetical protein